MKNACKRTLRKGPIESRPEQQVSRLRFFIISFGLRSYIGNAGSLKLVHDRFFPHPLQLIHSKSLPLDAIKSEHGNHFMLSDNMKHCYYFYVTQSPLQTWYLLGQEITYFKGNRKPMRRSESSLMGNLPSASSIMFTTSHSAYL
jgi:hypothetical protein